MYRPRVVDRLADSEKLERSLRVTTPQIWVAALFMLFVSVVVTIWAVVGEIPSYVRANGLLLESESKDILVTDTGIVAELYFLQGSRVTKNDLIAKIQKPEVSELLKNALLMVDERQVKLETLTFELQTADKLNETHLENQFNNLAELEELALEAVLTAEARVKELETKAKDEFTESTDLEIARDRHYSAQQALFDIFRQRNDLEFSESQRRLANDVRLQTAELELIAAVDKVKSIQETSDSIYIVAPADGRISELNFDLGEVVQSGQKFAKLEIRTGEIELMLYIPPAYGKMGLAGKNVLIYPSTINREDHGALKGKVVEVSLSPVGFEEIKQTVKNTDLVRTFTQNGQPYEGRVRLVPDTSTVSGFAWTSERGAAMSLSPGILVEAEIEIARKAPIEFVAPIFKNIFEE